MADLTEKKRKTLKELFNDPCAVLMDRAFMHQSFQVPGGGQESTISSGRPATRGVAIVYHPGYGLIGNANGKYFLAPSANVIVAHEDKAKAVDKPAVK